MKVLKQITVSLSLIGYIVLAVFGLFAMSSMHHHSMTSMSNCPFMVGEQSLCTMNYAEHIGAWQTLSNGPLVKIMMLVLPVLFVFFVFYLHPPNFARSRLYKRPFRESSITALFSQGILHSKAP